jgi:hypothetical protein
MLHKKICYYYTYLLIVISFLCACSVQENNSVDSPTDNTYVVCIESSKLNIRSLPNSTSLKKGFFYKGTQLELIENSLGDDEKWSLVKSVRGGMQGYVHSDYIKPLNPDGLAYYEKISNEYFPLNKDLKWIHHYYEGQDAAELNICTLSIKEVIKVNQDKKDVEIFLLESSCQESLNFISRVFANAETRTIANCFARIENDIHIAKYQNNDLEIINRIYTPTDESINLNRGEITRQVNYTDTVYTKEYKDTGIPESINRSDTKLLYQKKMDKYAQVNYTVNKEYPLNDDVNIIFGKNVGLYRLTKRGEASSKLLLLDFFNGNSWESYHQLNNKFNNSNHRGATSSRKNPTKNNDQSTGKWLCQNTFFLTEGGLKNSIQLEPLTDGFYTSGVLTLNQLGCDFVYNYTINRNELNCVFFQSTCSRPSQNIQFIIDKNRQLIKTKINHQYFEYGLKPPVREKYNSSANTPSSFETESDVFSYLQGKTFQSNDGSIKIKIGYNSRIGSYGIVLNGNPTHFNLTINILSSTQAYIKGESLTNSSGVVDFRVNSRTNCIENDGSLYCKGNR